ncbi:MAG: hypothetical protein AAFV19_08960 [Pseudomonadota bacterium]
MIAAVKANAAQTVGWAYQDGTDPRVVFSSFGRSLISIGCGQNDALHLSTVMFGRPGYSTNATKRISLTVGGWTSGPIDLQALPDRSGFALDLSNHQRIVEGLKSAREVTLVEVDGGAVPQKVSLEGVRPHIERLENACSSSAALLLQIKPKEQIQPEKPRPNKRRPASDADRVLASRYIARLTCQPGAVSPYCQDPDILALRAELVDAAAAAYARAPKAQRRQSLLGPNQGTVQTLYRCAQDKACLQQTLEARIAAWDAAYVAQTSPVVSNAYPGACDGALSATMQTVCRDTGLAELDSDLRARLESVRAEVKGTALAQQAERVLGTLISGIAGQCGTARPCLEQAYRNARAATEAYRERTAASLAQIRLQQEHRRKAQQAAAEAEAKRQRDQKAAEARAKAEKAAADARARAEQQAASAASAAITADLAPPSTRRASAGLHEITGHSAEMASLNGVIPRFVSDVSAAIPLQGPASALDRLGVEFVKTPGGFRIGRVALGSPLMMRSQLHSGMTAPVVTIDPDRDHTRRITCADEACLEEAIANMGEADFLRFNGYPLALGPTIRNAPWLRMGDTLSIRRTAALRAVAARTGLYFDEQNASAAVIKALASGSATQQAGLQVGDVVTVASRPFSKQRIPVVDAIGALTLQTNSPPRDVRFLAERTGDRRPFDIVMSNAPLIFTAGYLTLLNRPDGKAVASAALPEAFRNASADLRALYVGGLTPGDPNAESLAAGVLVALAERAPSCIVDRTTLKFSTTLTTTTTNGFGHWKGETVERFQDEMPVRRAFRPLLSRYLNTARAAAYYNSARDVVRRLRESYGCGSEPFLKLDAEIARIAGLTDLAQSIAAQKGPADGTDWADFNARCLSDWQRKYDQVIVSPSMAEACICVEYAIASLEDRALYAQLRSGYLTQYEALGAASRKRVDAVVGQQCPRSLAGKPAIVQQRFKAWQQRN